MIRLLLSLLALLTGATVPGMAQACDFAGSGTEIGARAEAGQQASAEAVQPQAPSAFAAVPAIREPTQVARELAAPRVATVLIGIDRARQ
jgi:hypothetical protein